MTSAVPSFAGRPERLVERTLAGGSRVLVLPTEGVSAVPGARGVVAIQLWILSGTASERREEHGCAHLLEHLVFKPTGQGGPDIASAIEALGGDVNAFTSHDETVFHATLPADAALDGLDALLAPIVQLSLDPTSLANEIEVVVEEIRQFHDDPGSRTLQEVMGRLFPAHAYGRPVLGTAEEIRAHDVARLRGFHARAYGADRARLVLVGPVDAEAVVRRARRWLSKLPPARARGREASPSHVAAAGRVAVRRQDVHEAYLDLGWQAPVLPQRDAVALEVAATILGHGDASRLSVGLRRRDRLVSDAHASFFGSRLCSTFFVSAHARGPAAGDAARAILAEVGRIGRLAPSAEELSRARTVLQSDLVYRRETTQGQAHVLGFFLSLAGDLDADRRYFEVLGSLTAEDVRAACARYLAPSGVAIAIAVPRSVPAAAVRAMRRELGSAVSLRPPQPVERFAVLGASPGKRGGGARKTRARGHERARVRQDGPIAWIDLPSGIRVRAVIDRGLPVVGAWLAWPGGLRLETARTHGTSPLMAELVTRGCEGIDGDRLAAEIEGSGAVLDGFSGKSAVGLHMECLASTMPSVLERALQCVVAPTFPAHEVAEEVRVAIQDHEAEADDLGRLAVAEAMRALYGRHPYALRRRGTPQTLSRLDRATLSRAWRRWYPLSRMVVGLSGDVDLEAALACIETIASGPAQQRPPAADLVWGGAAIGRGRARTIHTRRRKEQAHVVLAYPGLRFGDPQAAVLEVLVAILGGQSGRLFARVREDQGLAYHVSATSSEGLDAGDVVLYAATGQDKVERALAAMRLEVDRVRGELVGGEELARAQAWLLGQLDAAMERRSRIASLVAFDEALGQRRGASFAMRSRIARVDASAVRRLARRLLDPHCVVTSIVSA